MRPSRIRIITGTSPAKEWKLNVGSVKVIKVYLGTKEVQQAYLGTKELKR